MVKSSREMGMKTGSHPVARASRKMGAKRPVRPVRPSLPPIGEEEEKDFNSHNLWAASGVPSTDHRKTKTHHDLSAEPKGPKTRRCASKKVAQTLKLCAQKC